MNTIEDIDDPNGTFGGDSSETNPYISSIEIANGDRADRIDEGDKIIIVFNESIDPHTIDNDLEKGGIVEDVDEDDTGGVIVNSLGIQTVSDIAKFDVGSVDDNGFFDVDIELNSTGNVLTITLFNGGDIDIDNQNLDDAEQLGGTIEDEDGNEMEDDPNIDDPEGEF